MKEGIFNVDQSGSVKQMVILVQEQAVPPRENQHIVHPQEGPTHPPLGWAHSAEQPQPQRFNHSEQRSPQGHPAAPLRGISPAPRAHHWEWHFSLFPPGSTFPDPTSIRTAKPCAQAVKQLLPQRLPTQTAADQPCYHKRCRCCLADLSAG